MAAEIIHGIASFFTFRLSNQLFAVNVGNVTKILEMVPITKVPNSPGHFKGIINLFGEILPVFDGRLRLGFPEAGITRRTCILVLVFELEGQPVSTGIIIDSVEKVVNFDPEQIKPALVGGKDFNTEFIEGMVAYNNEFVIILNINRIFLEEEIRIINSVE